jgi:hypothetical protein
LVDGSEFSYSKVITPELEAIVLLKEFPPKLFDDFACSWHDDSWHPDDIRRLQVICSDLMNRRLGYYEDDDAEFKKDLPGNLSFYLQKVDGITVRFFEFPSGRLVLYDASRSNCGSEPVE